MSTVINSNIMATRTGNIYNRNNNYGNAALTRITTGQRINSAKDGASTWAISERHRDRINANDQANRNAQNDAALLKVAQGGLENTLDILRTLKERAVDSANDTNVSLDRSAIATEVRSLVNQIDENATTVKYNGRALLNGAADVSSAYSSSGSAAGVTATDPRGKGAAYSLTGLKTADANGLTTAISADSTVLTKLTDGSGNKLFQTGDTITFSWKENGQDVSKSYTIAADDSAVSDLVSGIGTTSKLTLAWKAADTALSSGNILNQNFTDLKSTDAGLYAYSTDAKVLITDLAVSVTRNTNGATSNVTAAQDAMKFTGIQQSFGSVNASNAVFAFGISDIDSTTAAVGTVSGSDLKTILNASSADTVKLTIDGKSVSVGADKGVSDLNAALKDAGINARVQFASTKGETLKYDGAEVMRGASGYESAAKSPQANGFYIIGDNKKEIGITTQDQLNSMTLNSIIESGEEFINASYI